MDRLVEIDITATSLTAAATDEPPGRARTVVIGGGIIGLSTAYHLAEFGETDVLVLEANAVSSGSSWHAAGLVTGSRSTCALTGVAKYGRDLYTRLEAQTGIDVDYQQAGSLLVARRTGRSDEALYVHDVAAQCGVETEIVNKARVKELWPFISTDGIVRALHIPGDGYMNPGYATLAFAKLALDAQVVIREQVRVEEILAEEGVITGVKTNRGTVECERVVLAAGLWSRDLALTAGVHVPLYSAEHIHVRSNELDGVERHLPVLRDLDRSYYIRPESGRLLVGAFEPDGIPREVETIATDGFATFPPNWNHFASIRRAAEQTVPDLVSAGFERYLNAPESFTPDGNFILGESAEVENLFVSAGYNSQGIIYAGGAGKELAAWVVSGAPQFDASEVDAQRFTRHQTNRRYLHSRTRESLGKLYDMHWPGMQPKTARNVRRSPLHSKLEQLGAFFAEQNGWERAQWYGEPGTRPENDYSYGPQNWFDFVADEHHATRNDVALFDLSSFTKVEVAGADALHVIQHAFTANHDKPVGRALYTLSLNNGGGIVLDGTVTRLAEDRFLVVTPAASQHRTVNLLQRVARDTRCVVTDVTGGYATIGVFGPQSRELLSRISPEDWSSEVQPYMTGREVELADGYGYALRVSFVGELGYELYIPTELAENVFDALLEAGGDLGARLAGYHALDGLRAEKGYRHLGHDIGPAEDPYTAGLGFAVALSKEGEFIGRAEAEKAKNAQRERRTVYVKLEQPRRLLHGDEAIFFEGARVGRVASGAYGYTFDAAMAIAFIDAGLPLDTQSFKVESQGKLYAATVSKMPFYDPKGERLKV